MKTLLSILLCALCGCSVVKQSLTPQTVVTAQMTPTLSALPRVTRPAPIPHYQQPAYNGIVSMSFRAYCAPAPSPHFIAFQGSPDLIHWTTMATFQADASTDFDFVATSKTPMAFYRAVTENYP